MPNSIAGELAPNYTFLRNFAKAVLVAAELREASWDKEAYEAERKEMNEKMKAHPAWSDAITYLALHPNPEEFYRKAIFTACEEACRVQHLEGAEHVIKILLLTAWNDALDWATRTVEAS